MICAKRTKSAQRLTKSLQKDLLKRSYLALLKGDLSGTHRWEHFLIKNEKTNKATLYRQKMPGTQHCLLEISAHQKISTAEGPCTLCEITLETGRSHQIRAQSAFEKHPLLGDAKYGSPSRLIERPALHSARLSFPHPMSAEILTFEDPLPEDFKKILK